MTVTTPTAPESTLAQEVATVEKKIGVWLDPAHIILVLLLIGALVGGAYLYESKRADVSDARAQIATQIAAAAQKTQADEAIQNAANQEQAKQVEAAMVAANQQLITANQQLVKANAQLSTQLATQKKVDAALPPSGQAQRWEQLVPQAQVSVTPTGFAIDPVGGLNTILALETVQTQGEQIKNFEAEVANDEKELANAQLSFKAEQAAHQSDLTNSQAKLIAAQDNLKKVNDDFTAYKHKARRNYIRAFFAGVIVGIIGGHAAGL